MTLPVRPPLEPMLAKLAREMPEAAGLLFEPKWDGFRCIVFRDGNDLDLQSRNSRPLLRYFPELRDPLLALLPARCVVDGELVVATERGLDFDALQLRQHPAESRVRRLAAEIPASFVAFDLIADGDDSLLDVPFGERRARLEALLAGARPPVHITPATSDRATALDWFERFEGAGFDGVVAKPLAGTYRPGERTMIKVKHERTADCVVPGYRMHKDRQGVGSLLLGLYDDAGVLHHVGVASSMSAALRAELVEVVRPFEADALVGHPWRDWGELAARDPGQRMPGGVSRWNADKDLSFVALRLGLVAEVAYEGMQQTRFRHNARFRRWRPDRDIASCTYAQLEVVPPVELLELLG